MMKWIRENDIILRVTSLLIAVLLWAYAVSQDQSDVKQTFRDLPIQLEGVNALKAQELVILSGGSATVDVELTGKREQLNTAQSDPYTSIKRTVSVENITEPGTYQLGIEAAPVGLGDTSVSGKSPASVTIVVDRMSTASIPVELELTGQLGEGLELADYSVSPDAITVRGPETVLRQIEKAKVVYDISQLTAPLQTSVTFTLQDEDGEEVANSYLSTDTPSTMLNIELRQEGDIMTTVELIDSPYLKSYMVTVDIDPEYVRLKGDPTEISEINQLMLNEIDLSEVVEKRTTSFTRLIQVPDGLSLATGQKPFATVTLTLDGYDWKTMELDQSILPESELFTYPEQTFSVELFGEESALRRIRSSDVTLELSYDLAELVEGDNLVPCRVSLPDEDIYIEQSLEVTVQVTQEALDALRSPEPADPDAPVTPEE